MRQIVGGPLRVLPAARLPHEVSAVIDPLRRDAGAEQERPRDFPVGPSRGRDRPASLGRVDAMHLAQGGMEGIAVGVSGAGDERAVDIEQKQHAGRASAFE